MSGIQQSAALWQSNAPRLTSFECRLGCEGLVQVMMGPFCCYHDHKGCSMIVSDRSGCAVYQYHIGGAETTLFKLNGLFHD